jgi:hypothetical protein
MIVKWSNGQVSKRSESLRNTIDLQTNQSSKAEMIEDELTTDQFYLWGIV